MTLADGARLDPIETQLAALTRALRTVDRIDFLRRTVTVDRQLVTPPKSGKPTFGRPKTKACHGPRAQRSEQDRQPLLHI